MLDKLRSPAWRIGLLSFGGFLLYGTWAFGINWQYGMKIALSAGIAQGISSAIATACNTAVSEFCFARWGAMRAGALLAWLLPPSLTMIMHAAFQWAAGTPGILVTILPSSILGYVFAAIYVRGLIHFRRKNLEALANQKSSENTSENAASPTPSSPNNSAATEVL